MVFGVSMHVFNSSFREPHSTLMERKESVVPQQEFSSHWKTALIGGLVLSTLFTPSMGMSLDNTVCVSTTTTALQGKIDQLHWKEQLSLCPPRPERSYPIKEKQANQWVDAHVCKKQKEAARSFIKATQHITQQEFEAELKKSVDQFNDWLDGQESQDYILVVNSKNDQKSNRWVAELALPHLKVLPKNVLAGHLADLNDVIEFYKENRSEIKKFVFFDDAAYGCSQSKYFASKLTNLDFFADCGEYGEHCNEIQGEEILKAEKDYAVVAIIPFMRDENCILPDSSVDETSWPKAEVQKHIRVFTSKKLPKLHELLTPEEMQNLKECQANHVPVYFDHKIADSFSTCSDVYVEGEVTNSFETCTLEDFWEEPPSLWQRVVDCITGDTPTSRMFRKYTAAVKATEQVDTKFVDAIVPPYKG